MNSSPRPWHWEEGGTFIRDEIFRKKINPEDLGRIIDAVGNEVLHFGNSEPCDCSCGREPTEADTNLIIAAVNAYKEPPQ
jgi:hypothetical protein